MTRTSIWVVMGALLGAALIAQAAGPVRHDNFNIAVAPGGIFAGGDGSGYPEPPDNSVRTAGLWYPYDSGWINQWFWNDPFTWDSKWITYDIAWNKMILIEPTGAPTPPGSIEIAINWSTPAWSLTANPPTAPRVPPLPPMSTADESLYIHRDVIVVNPALDFAPGGYHIAGTIIIPDYNPEWVSIDVRGSNFQAIGRIDHQCVPEPAGLVLGALLVPALRRRRAALDR